MALLDDVFDINSLPEQQNSFDPIPEGWYEAVISKADVKPTKDKTGQYINMQYAVTGPAHQGRVVFSIVNIRNKSAEAQNIGLQQLGSIMRAVGLTRVDDTDQLIGGRLLIKVTIRKQDGYEPTNDVRGYKAIEGAVMPAAAAPAGAKEAGSKAAPPWSKK
jgi:hypothetical protein